MAVVCLAAICSVYADDESVLVARLGVSEPMFRGIRQADVTASLEIWSRYALDPQEVRVEEESSLYQDWPSIKRDLEQGRIDLVMIQVSPGIQDIQGVVDDTLFIPVSGGRSTVDYLLLVSRDSGAETLADLRGKTVAISESFRMGMAPLWLDTRLLESNLPVAESFFLDQRLFPKASPAILQVFFGKADACLVSRQSFETVVEMNPQIRRRLLEIEHSPQFVSSCLAIRKGFIPPGRWNVLDNIYHLHETARGRQILSFFNTEQLKSASWDVLSSSRELMEHHRELTEAAAAPTSDETLTDGSAKQ